MQTDFLSHEIVSEKKRFLIVDFSRSKIASWRFHNMFGIDIGMVGSWDNSSFNFWFLRGRRRRRRWRRWWGTSCTTWAVVDSGLTQGLPTQLGEHASCPMTFPDLPDSTSFTTTKFFSLTTLSSFSSPLTKKFAKFKIGQTSNYNHF